MFWKIWHYGYGVHCASLSNITDSIQIIIVITLAFIEITSVCSSDYVARIER